MINIKTITLADKRTCACVCVVNKSQYLSVVVCQTITKFAVIILGKLPASNLSLSFSLSHSSDNHSRLHYHIYTNTYIVNVQHNFIVNYRLSSFSQARNYQDLFNGTAIIVLCIAFLCFSLSLFLFFPLSSFLSSSSSFGFVFVGTGRNKMWINEMKLTATETTTTIIKRNNNNDACHTNENYL